MVKLDYNTYNISQRNVKNEPREQKGLLNDRQYYLLQNRNLHQSFIVFQRNSSNHHCTANLIT